MHQSKSLVGRRVMVAGATGVIGRATCALLLNRGATVIAVGRSQEKLGSLKDGLAATPHSLHALCIHGLDREAWERVLADSVCLTGGIDAFIHAAGVIVPGAFLELKDDEIDLIIRTNLLSVITAAGVILPAMVRRHSGHFIVVGSLGGMIPMPFETIYATTKFALRGFCLSLHEELRDQGVTVSLVSPGPVRSPMLDLEGSDPRAALTFVQSAIDPASVAARIVDLLGSRRREARRPLPERMTAVMAGFSPELFGHIFPLLGSIGRRNLSRRETESHEYDNPIPTA